MQKNKREKTKIINRCHTSIRIWWKNRKWIWNSNPWMPHENEFRIKWCGKERERVRKFQDIKAIQLWTLCVNRSIHYFITLNLKDLCKNDFSTGPYRLFHYFHFNLNLYLSHRRTSHASRSFYWYKLLSLMFSHNSYSPSRYSDTFFLVCYCHWQSPGHLRNLYLIFFRFSFPKEILFFKIEKFWIGWWTVNHVFNSWWLNGFSFS